MTEKVTNLAPPEPLKVPAKFAEQLGVDTVKSLTIDRFVGDFFAKVVGETNRNDVGLRAVFYTQEKDTIVEVPGWSGSEKIVVATLEDILEKGGEYDGASVLVTRMGVNDDLGNSEIDMTREYLRFATLISLAAVHDINPAILVYDLTNVQLEEGSYKVTYPNAQAKKEALQMVYPMEVSGLKKVLEENARMKS